MGVTKYLLSGMILQVVGREDPWDGGSLNLDFMILFFCWVDFFLRMVGYHGMNITYLLNQLLGEYLKKKTGSANLS